MKPLQTLLDDYLVSRRMLGAKLEESDRLLHQFVEFLEEYNVEYITTERALEWATLPREALPPYRARRLAEVRHFAAYASAIDPQHQVPPNGLLPYGRSRRHPYIYRDDEVIILIRAAHALTGRIRPLTYATILGLLSVTGMRSSEVVRLDRDDVDIEQGVITVRNSKFGKSRLMPCHDTTRQALGAYVVRRDENRPQPRSCAFFLSEQGKRISAYTLRETFAKLCRSIGLRQPGESSGPRLHDLRHRFAIRTLMRWYREGGDVALCLPRLATWLGHVNISSTYWYLSAIPELMELAAVHLDRVQQGAKP